MKNFISKILIIAATMPLLFAASKPSIDGRALVADTGELPPGLYIKAATFLPGDTVVITNPALNISIEVMVFGTFTAADGIAAVLSPETALKLHISKDANSIVQITKTGTDTDAIALAGALKSASAKFEAEPVPPVLEPVSEEVLNTPEPLPPISEPAVRPPEPDPAFADELIGKRSSDDRTPSTGDDVVYSPFANMEKLPVNAALTSRSDLARGTSPEFRAEPKADATVQTEPLIEIEPAAKPMTELQVERPNFNAPAVENPPVPEPVPSSPPVFPETLPDYFVKDEPEVQVIEPTEDIVIKEDAALAAAKSADPWQSSHIAQYIIDNIRSLGKGTYCIQLATYREAKNILKIIEVYGKRYPIRLVRSEKIPDAYQVLVAPLNSDEYTLVLKRFIDWGFTDAFLRKIN